MAYYRDEEEENGNVPVEGAIPIGAQSATITPGQGASGGATTAKTNAPDNPGNFVGLQQYLKANRPQAQKLGDQTAGIINSSANQARQGVQALNQEAGEKIRPVGQLSTDVSDKLRNRAEDLTQDERNTIKSTSKATYQGPQTEMDLSSYQNASDAQKKAQENIDRSGTEAGRMSLISQVNSKPRTQGMNVFDNALLQAGGGREKLAQAANQNQDIKGSLDQAAQNIRSQIGRADDSSTADVDESAGAIGQTNKSQADAYQKIQDALNTWTSGFTPKVAQAQQNFVDLQNRVTGDLGNNQLKLDQDTLDLLGLNTGDQVFGLDLKSYLNPGSVSDINTANVATPEDYARYAALADLADVQNLALKPEDLSMAGTAPQFSADKDRLRQDMQAAATNYENLYANKDAATQLSSVKDALVGDRQGKSIKELEALLDQWKQGGFEADSGWQAGGESQQSIYNRIMNAIDKWKVDQNYFNTINDLPMVPTKDGGKIDWGQLPIPSTPVGKAPIKGKNPIVPGKKK